MSSAVADAPTISTPNRDRVYIARHSDLLLILARDRKRVAQETGETIETIQGKRLKFIEGELTVPEKGIVRGARGEQLAAQEVVDLLEGRGEPGDEDFIQPHPKLGDMEEGFWLRPKLAPPMSEAEAQQVVDLAIARDAEGLHALLTAEQNGWERSDMLDLVASTLDKVEAAQQPEQGANPDPEPSAAVA